MLISGYAEDAIRQHREQSDRRFDSFTFVADCEKRYFLL